MLREKSRQFVSAGGSSCLIGCPYRNNKFVEEEGN